MEDTIKGVQYLRVLFDEMPNIYLMVISDERVKSQIKSLLNSYDFKYTNRLIGRIKRTPKAVINYIKNYDVERYMILTSNSLILNDEAIKDHSVNCKQFNLAAKIHTSELLESDLYNEFDWRNSVKMLMTNQGETWSSLAEKMDQDASNLRKRILFKNPTLDSMVSLFDTLGYDLKMYIKKQIK